MVLLNSGGNYLSASNVKENDTLEFLDAGKWEESSKYTYEDGNPKKDFVMRVKYKGEEYKMNVGKYSRDELIPAYGDDSDLWVGKTARIHIETYRSLKKDGIILFPVAEKTLSEKKETATEPQKETIKAEDIIWDEEKNE